jgi:WD40 repeat protein
MGDLMTYSQSDGAGFEPDMFDDHVVERLLDVSHHRPRPWLEQRVTSLLRDPDCRIVLITADPGAGKSVLLAGLAAAHPDSLRYFLRWDSVHPRRAGDVHSFLEAVGHQLAARFPELQLDADLVVEVEQSVQQVGPTGRVVGVRAEEVWASPFRRTAIKVRQTLGSVEGGASGLEVGRLVIDLRAMDWRDVEHLALLGPLRAMSSRRPHHDYVLLLIDALDESATGLGEWLASCPSLPANLRVVVTARDGEYLQTIRLKQSGQLRELRIDTVDSQAQADVSGFLTAASQTLDLSGVSTQGREQLVTEWAAAAAGNFQFAATLMSALRASVRSGDTGTTRALSALGAVPPGLRALYTLLITNLRNLYRPQSVRLDDGTAGSAWDDLYAPALGTLAVVRQPVSAAELTVLAGIRARSSRVRDVLTDMLHFLDARDGTYRLHHRSFADFLTDPRTERETPGCYLDPAEWHLSAGLAGGRAVLEAPGDGSTAAYGRAHACAHLIRAVTATSPDPAGRAMLASLNRLDVLMARMEAVGVDVLTDEVRDAAPLLETEARVAEDLGKSLDRQRHNLRSGQSEWRPPGFLAQQLYNEAVSQRWTDVARIAAAALSPSAAALMLVWSVGNDARALLRTVTIGAHANALARVDDNRFVAGCGDGSLGMYEASSGKLLARRGVTDSEILAVGWSPQYGIVWGSAGGLVGCWHPDTEKVHELRVPGVSGAPQSFTTYSPMIAMTALNRQEPTWFTGGPGSVHAIAVREADGEIAIGTRQGAVLVIHPGFTEFAAGYPLHAQVITGLHFSGDSIVACSHDGTVRRTNLISDSVIASAPCPYTALTVLTRKRVLAIRWDGGSDLIEASDIASMSKSGVTLGPATAVGANPQGWAFIGFMNRRIWVLDADMTFRASLRGHGDQITAAVGLSAKTLVSASKDRTIRVWDLADERPSASPSGHDGPVTALLFTEDGLMSGSADGTLRFWGPGGDQREARDLQSGQIWYLSHGPNGTFAAATQAGRVVLGHLQRGIEVLSGHTDEAKAVVTLADGRVLSADKSGAVIVWERRRRSWQASQIGAPVIPGNVNSMAVVGTHQVALAHGASEITVLDVNTGTARQLSGHEISVYAVAAGPSSTILSGGSDCTARVWSAATGQCLQVYREHTADVSALGALDDQLIVSGAGDGSVHVWNRGSGRTLAVALLGQPVDRLAVDRHGQRVAAAHPNGGISVFDTSPLLRLTS